MFRNFILLAAAVVALPTITYAADDMDKDFLSDAIKGDNSEISLGQLAMEKGAAVRDFGQTLVTDHTKAKEDAEAVVRKLGLQSTDDMTPEAVKEKGKLEDLSGADFDEEFIDYMISDHEKDIAKFQKQAKLDTATASLARQTLPALEKHLKMAKDIDGKMR